MLRFAFFLLFYLHSKRTAGGERTVSTLLLTLAWPTDRPLTVRYSHFELNFKFVTMTWRVVFPTVQFSREAGRFSKKPPPKSLHCFPGFVEDLSRRGEYSSPLPALLLPIFQAKTPQKQKKHSHENGRLWDYWA